MARFAAVDLGASNGRVILGDVTPHSAAMTEVHRFANAPARVPDGEGSTYYTPVVALFEEVCRGLRKADAEAGGLTAIGIDSWGVDYGLIGQGGRLAHPMVHYRDRRTEPMLDKLFGFVDRSRYYGWTGSQVQPFNTIFQLIAALDRGEISAGDRALLLPDLLGYWLTGVQVAEATNASTTGMLDPVTRRWHQEILSLVREHTALDPVQLLAGVVEPGNILGELQGEAADLLGISPATRVVNVASHDTGSAVAAIPATTDEFAFISCGTWSIVGVELDTPVLTEDARRLNFGNELGVDGTVRFISNVMGLWPLQEMMREWSERGEGLPVADLVRDASRVTPLRFRFNAFDPRLLHPGGMTERVAELSREMTGQAPATPAEYARCVLDSLAVAYRVAIAQAQELSGTEVRVVHMVGGGVQNELLVQLTSDATGLPIVAGPVEGAALGNLLVQARAAGVVEGTLQDLRRIPVAGQAPRRYVPGASFQQWAAAAALIE